MALADTQRLVTRLVTEPILLERFLTDPEGTARAEGWPIEAIRTLESLAANQLRDYGKSLLTKRCHEAAKCLRLTRRVLGANRFAELFRTHAASFRPTGPKRHRDDAAAFATALLSSTNGCAEWVSDLVMLERAVLLACDPKRRWVAVRLRHEPNSLCEATCSGGRLFSPARRPQLLVWLRLQRDRPPRLMRFLLPELPWRVTRNRGSTSRPHSQPFEQETERVAPEPT